jgi:hypothetical protein
VDLRASLDAEAKRKNPFPDPAGIGVGWRITLRSFFENKYINMWIGFIWFRIGASGGVLRIWQLSFGFHKRREIY